MKRLLFAALMISGPLWAQGTRPPVYDFLGLLDTPDSYSGQAGKVVLVNPAANGLIFGTVAGMTDVKWDGSAIVPPGTAADGRLSLGLGTAALSDATAFEGQLSFDRSIVQSVEGAVVRLAGDVDTPGASKYYGTDGTSTKGWFALPAAGGVTSFSSGDLSPLFTTTEPNTAGAVAQSFALTNVTGPAWFGKETAGSGAPAYSINAFPAALIPAFTGDVTKPSGSLTQTLVNIPLTTTINGVTGTRGDVLYYGATGWAKLGAGTSGNQLTTNGAGADPTWAAPGSGGGGTVTTTGSPSSGQMTKFSGATSITNAVAGTDYQAPGAYLTANQPISLTGDVTGGPAATSIATTIGNNKVTLGMMATMATDSILGRATASTGNVEVLSALPFAYTGDVTRPVDSNVTTLAAGNAGNLNSGTLLAARMPALTGDITTTAGTVATTYNNAVPTTKAGLPTGGTANQALTKIDGTNYNTQWTTLGGGSGTVTNFSAGDLSPLFTTTEATTTTTPALSFVLSNATGPAWFGVASSGSFAPAYNITALPAALIPAFSGDVSTSGLTTTIGANKVTLPMMATMATDSILGRKTASTGNVEVLTALPWADTGDVTRAVDGTATTLANIPAATTIGGAAGTRGDVLFYGASGWAKLAAGTSGNQLTTNGAGADPSWAAAGSGGGGTPAGPSTAVQFEDAGAFGGDAGLTYNKTGDVLTLASTGLLAFSTDTAIGRIATGTAEVNNGTLGQLRDLKLRSLILDDSGSAPPIASLQIENAPADATPHIRLRDRVSPRYRSDVNIIAAGGGLTFNAFDDTGGVYLPVIFDGLPVKFRASAAETLTITAGNVALASGVNITGNGTVPTGGTTSQVLKKNSNTNYDYAWAADAGGAGSGDVVGPASATDNAIARFDTTTGKLIQNSLVTIADDGSITGPVNLTLGNAVYAAALLTGGQQVSLMEGYGGIILGTAGGGMGIGWSDVWYNPQDLRIFRNAPGILEINNGTTGQYRDLLVRNLDFGSTAVSLSGGAGGIGAHTLWTINGVIPIHFTQAYGTIVDTTLGFINGYSTGIAPDVSLAYSAANTIKVTNGSTGYGNLQVNNLTVNGTCTGCGGGGGSVSDGVFPTGWDTDTTTAPSRNAVYDYLHIADTNDNGKMNVLDQVAGITNTNSSGVIQTPITAPAGAIVGTTDTQTLSNKRITPRVLVTNAPGAAPTINTDNYDSVSLTGINAAITSMTTNLSGTPNNFDKLTIRFKDDGTARAIAWGASYASSQATLPTTTVAGKVTTVGLLRDSVKSSWECVAVDVEDAGYATLQTTYTNSAGTTSTTYVMGGIGGTITPQVSGKIVITYSGSLTNNNAAGTCWAALRYGPGSSVPAHGTADTGTFVGGVGIRSAIGANLIAPSGLTAVVTGLTVGTTYWVDTAYQQSGGGTATLWNCSMAAWEIP